MYWYLHLREHFKLAYPHTLAEHPRKTRSCIRTLSASAGSRLTYDQPTINNHNKRHACAIVCDAVCDDTRARVLSSLALCRGDNFNLNKWSGGRHLCPRLVLFILDYSERTCAAVSSAGRVRCLLSRVNVFQNPSGIHQVVPDRRADRPTDRPTRPSDPSA